MDAAAILDDAARCLLAARGRRGPIVAPMAHWFDGDALWMTTAADTAKVGVLRRDPRCAVAVAPREDGLGVVGLGRARVFTAHQPARLALHAPAITGAMWGLAARNVSAIADYATHIGRIPARWAPHHRVVLRVAIETLELVQPPPPPAGFGPALPTAVPGDVRRRLSGKRSVMVLWDQPPLRLASATWSSGFALSFAGERPAAPPPPLRPQPGDRIAAVVDDDRGRPTDAVGTVVHGELGDDGALVPDRVTWWRGFEAHTAEVTPPSAGVVIPE